MEAILRTPEENRRRADAQRTASQAKQEALELVLSYAQDVVDYWPQMTLRTIRVMIVKMASLKEALEMYRKA